MDECRQSCVYRASQRMRFWECIGLCRGCIERVLVCVPAPYGTNTVLMKSILMTDKIVEGIQIVI